MKRPGLLAAAALSVILMAATDTRADTTAPAAVPAPAPVASLDLRNLVALGIREMQTGDYKAAIEDLGKAMADPGFTSLPDRQRASIIMMLAGSEMESGQAKAGYEHLRTALRMAPDLCSDDCQIGRFYAAWGASDYDAMGEAALTVATSSPQKAHMLSVHALYQLFDELRKSPDTASQRRALLQALRKADYKPQNPLWDGEGLWFQLMQLDTEAGDIADARALVANFHDPSSYIAIQSDKRYSAYIDAFKPSGFQAVFDADLVRKRADMVANPQRAEAIVFLSSTLAEHGRADEAMPLIDAALAKIAAAPKDQPAFHDEEDQTNWLRETRADLLWQLGRNNEAMAMQVSAAADSEDKVSHAINLADAYNSLDKPQQALDALKDVDDSTATPYGRMAAAEARVCAWSALHDQPHVDEGMAYLRAHAKDGPGPIQSALMCINDLEGLATLYLAQLDDPEQRTGALSEAQIYIDPPNMTSYLRRRRAALHSMLSRPDVQAAIAKYGYINSYPIVR